MRGLIGIALICLLTSGSALAQSRDATTPPADPPQTSGSKAQPPAKDEVPAKNEENAPGPQPQLGATTKPKAGDADPLKEPEPKPLQ